MLLQALKGTHIIALYPALLVWAWTGLHSLYAADAHLLEARRAIQAVRAKAGGRLGQIHCQALEEGKLVGLLIQRRYQELLHVPSGFSLDLGLHAFWMVWCGCDGLKCMHESEMLSQALLVWMLLMDRHTYVAGNAAGHTC